MSDQFELATFGAGCFWGVEARFRELAGVLDATSGYMGGKPDPDYRAVCAGGTGHAEVVQVKFNPQEVGYETLLALALQQVPCLQPQCLLSYISLKLFSIGMAFQNSCLFRCSLQ